MREHGYSRERAERIVGAAVRDEKTAKIAKISKIATVIKANPERRLVTAVTNVLTDREGNSLVDSDDDIMDIDNLEEYFINAFGAGGVEKSGSMHERDGGGDIAQYFTISRELWKAFEEGDYIGKDIGVVKIRVHDDAMWADVKSGKTLEASIDGEGERTPV